MTIPFALITVDKGVDFFKNVSVVASLFPASQCSLRSASYC